MNITRALAIALEGAGISVITAGIVVEFVLHADIGYILITGGSLAVATGGLVFAKFARWNK